MTRYKIRPALSSATLVFLATFVVSCGSSNSGGGGKQGPYDVVGNWQVQFSTVVGASNYGFGAIDSGGVAAFFDSSGNIFQLPAISGVSSFSGNLNAYAVNGSPFSGGVYSITDPAQGTVTSSTAVGGTFSTSGSSGTFTVSPYSPVTGSLVPLSGAYQAKYLGFSDVVSFNFGSNGAFTGTDAANIQASGCGFSGTITQQGSSNVFDISYSTIAGNGCVANTVTGIAFQSNRDYFDVDNGADASYFYAIILTSTVQSVRPYVVVIYP